jgi:uncharacterized integral membrane protein (TIGR00701 family)
VFHLIGLVFWLGSLLVVTHVLALHTQERSPEGRAALARLEMKLFRGLAHPGAAVMVVSGIALLSLESYALREVWMQAKLVLVLVLIGLDLMVYRRTAAFHAGRIELRSDQCRAWHGAIAGLFLAILVLVLVKPFA